MKKMVRKDDDPRLIDLCTKCLRPSCSGDKCREYIELEKIVYGRATEQERKGSIVDIKMIRRPSGEKGLRLYNLAIDMLEDLKEQTDEQKQCQIETMVQALRRWRMETYESAIDWYALEGDE